MCWVSTIRMGQLYLWVWWQLLQRSQCWISLESGLRKGTGTVRPVALQAGQGAAHAAVS